MSAGPAPYRMTSPLGPVWPAAAVPMAPKMPAPMTAPIASMTRSPAPNTRLRERASSPGGCSSEIGLRANRCGTGGTLNHEAHEIREGHCISCSVEAVGGFVRGDDHLTVRPERDADERRS